MRHLGHIVLNVSSLERSLAFYCDVLGLRKVTQRDCVAFLSFGDNHHDVALCEVDGARSPDGDFAGLRHVAFCVGSHTDELRAAKLHLQSRGVAIERARNHLVTQSLYFRDPDGLLIEIYVDGDPAAWRQNPSLVAHSEPLDLA